MKHSRYWVLLALIVVTVLSACNVLQDDSQAGPTASSEATDAVTIANKFLNGWVNNDYTAMYKLLSPKALLLSPDQFADIYKNVEQTLRITEHGKSFEILKDKTVKQGNTTVIYYNMTFDSGPLGKFTDPDRVMRLILVGGKWLVAWSQMDIFDGLSRDAKLVVEPQQSKRGTIYDRNGKVIAQDGIVNYAVRLLPGDYPTGKAEDCFHVLATVFRMRTDDLIKDYGAYTKAQFRNFGFTVGVLSEGDYKNLKGQLDAACYLGYQRQVSRFYYGGSFAAQTIGFIGPIPKDELGNRPDYNASTLVGRAGVEEKWQDQLAGKSGARLIITAPDGTVIRQVAENAPGDSQDVKVTLDRDIQLAAEKALAGAFNFANWAQYSHGAAAVVIDIHNGNILALASYPTVQPDAFLISTTTFDADELQKYQTKRSLSNRAVQELYAPGSIFKIITSAAAVGTKTVAMDDIYVCRGFWDGSTKGDKKRYDWIYTDKYEPKPYHDAITFEQALTASCDAYYWEVASKLFDNRLSDKLREYANDMGLGVKTGVDILQEQDGVIPDPDWKFKTKGIPWGIGDTLNTVIGQGDVNVTPLEVARMMMGLANGGKLYVPHIVESVGAPGATPSYVAKTEAPKHIKLGGQDIKGIQDGLCQVTRDKDLGTAHFLFGDHWDFNQVSVCGKTGTAQTGTPYPNGWFAVYAGKPGAEPDIAIAVLVETSREGSETAGPIVRRIIESYYGLLQTPWPKYWTGAYDPLTNPDSVSDGGGPRQ